MPAVTAILTSLFGLVFIGFGINACVNTASALGFFEIAAPSTAEGRLLVAAMSPVYGSRDIFMGISMLATAIYGDSKAMGVIAFAAGAIAGVDGAVCRWVVGGGEWNHWGYAPILLVLGLVVMLSSEEPGKRKAKKT